MEIFNNIQRKSPHNEWYIIHDNGEVISHGLGEQGKQLDTGKTLEVTQVYNDYVTRCNELNITPVE